MNKSISLSEENINSIRKVYDNCDLDASDRIHINQLPGLIAQLGKSQEDTLFVIEEASKVASNNLNNQISFDDLIEVLDKQFKYNKSNDLIFDGPDPKVIEFLRILEEYRLKCEDDGNYLEAARAHKQLVVLRKQEEKRQQKAIRARQISERQDIQIAHSIQFHEFNKSWDKYMEEFDTMAQTYIQQMTERHAVLLLDYQKTLREELAKKPPKWSKELIELKRKQGIQVKNRNYIEAQKLKKLCDKIEEKEKLDIEQNLAIIFTRKETQFRLQQQIELQALLKRIECRRKEHIKQRNLDCKRLLQRNKNVQNVLESKQNLEYQKTYDDIRKNLTSSSINSHITNKSTNVNINNNTTTYNNDNSNENQTSSYDNQTSSYENQSNSYDNDNTFTTNLLNDEINNIDSNNDSRDINNDNNNDDINNENNDEDDYNDIKLKLEDSSLLFGFDRDLTNEQLINDLSNEEKDNVLSSSYTNTEESNSNTGTSVDSVE